MRRYAPLCRGARAAAQGDLAGCGLPHAPFGACRMGRRRARLSARRDAADGREHLRVLPFGCEEADGPGPVLSFARPRRIHPFHGRTPAHAARARRAQPHYGRIVCVGRAFDRPASFQSRGAGRRDARPRRGRQFGGARRSRHAGAARRRPYHRNGSRRGRSGRQG